MVEIAAYEVSEHIGEVELRQYPALRVATVSGLPDDGAFRILFKYISGGNRTKQNIAMTAPVLSDATTMAFVLPPRFSTEEVPEPRDTRVRIQEILPRTVAVIRFKGYADEESVAEVKTRLFSALKTSGSETIGEPFLMRYNAPFTPGFLRRNEVGIEVKREKA